jgi:adenosylmethionine-8-amino-7-oxononanoate aminotransferase
MMKIELVKNRATKEPFPVADKIAPTIQATGLKQKFPVSLIPGGGVADGIKGDLIVISPAYSISKADAELIVERAAAAIEYVLGKSQVMAKL